MSSDDTPGEDETPSSDRKAGNDDEFTGEESDVRGRLEAEADRAAQQIDESVVDLLAWVLDTETRARIYVELRQNTDSTSDEIAEGTGLYPSTVREALAELNEEGKVERRKRESDGAGNNPYEYRAMAPTELVRDVIEDVQRELNTVFNLDRYLGGEDGGREPVKINVEDESEVHDAVETTEVETPDSADSPDGSDDGDDAKGNGDDGTGTGDPTDEDHEQ